MGYLCIFKALRHETTDELMKALVVAPTHSLLGELSEWSYMALYSVGSTSPFDQNLLPLLLDKLLRTPNPL